MYLQPFTKENGEQVSIIIWKSHHAFSDGISIMSFTLSMSEEYDRSYFVKSTDAGFLQRLAVRAMVPLYIPYILWNSLTLGTDHNVVTVDKKKRLTGTFNCASSNELHMPDIKNLSKRIGVTINDIVTCSISTAIHDFFRSKGDKSTAI